MAGDRIELALEGRIAEIVHTAIASGEFRSADDVVSEALALWAMDRSAHAQDLMRLRGEIAEALDDPGSDMTIDEARAHLSSRNRSNEAA